MATIKMLDTKGPNHISIRAIAKQAGVSTGLVNYHFVGKEELLMACVQKFYDDLASTGAAVLSDVAGTPDLRVTLSYAATLGYRVAKENRTLVRVIKKLVAEKGGLPPTMRQGSADELLQGWSQMISARSGIPVKEVRLRLHSLASTITLYAVSSQAELQFILGDIADVDADIEQYVGKLAERILDV